ncbi:MAG TPA: AAA family ATPase [Bacillota bacterium]
MKHWEWLIGVALGVILYLWWIGIDLTPLILIGAAVVLLIFLTRGNLGKNFEVLAKHQVAQVETEVKFEDIGGQEVAKRELLEALDFVKDFEKVTQMGIRPLKGILLIGPPGTGKTLLAKAASNYTDSVFVSASGSEFIEMYAGVGAQRVRNLFSKARHLAKKSGKQSAIIFIDEIEVIAGKRGSHTSHLEYDQTLNQLLVEMDGINSDEAVKVVVIAATNRDDLLDKAILRPGRFDRHVKVDLPDQEGRLHILKIHSKGKPLSAAVNLAGVAKDTFGFSGAHLESLINEAAILAYRKHHSEIGMDDIREAIDKVMMGEKLECRVDPEELKRVAFHEVGHALVSEILRPQSVASVTIVPRGKALGFMRQAQSQEHYLYTKDYLLDQIAICLGGALTEELIYHNRSTGAANDFEQATSVAKQVINTGLSDLGIIQEDLVNKDLIYQTMKQILAVQEERVKAILSQHEPLIREIGRQLLEQERVSGEWFREQLTKIA